MTLRLALLTTCAIALAGCNLKSSESGFTSNFSSSGIGVNLDEITEYDIHNKDVGTVYYATGIRNGHRRTYEAYVGIDKKEDLSGPGFLTPEGTARYVAQVESEFVRPVTSEDGETGSETIYFVKGLAIIEADFATGTIEGAAGVSDDPTIDYETEAGVDNVVSRYFELDGDIELDAKKPRNNDARIYGKVIVPDERGSTLGAGVLRGKFEGSIGGKGIIGGFHGAIASTAFAGGFVGGPPDRTGIPLPPGGTETE